MLLTLLAVAHAQENSSPDARFALALYCDPLCSDEVMDALDEGLRSIRSRDGFGERVTSPQRIMGLAGTDFGIPDADYVALYGVEVGDATRLAASQQVLIAWFAGPAEESLSTLAVAHAAFTRAAKQSGGWVEDLDTGTVYGAAAWAALDPRGPVTGWFVTQASPTAEGADSPLRLVTQGLRRFGVPELVVENVPVEAAGDVGFVVNATAETLAARRPGLLPTSLPIQTASVTGTASLTPIDGTETDPPPPLLRLRFEGSVTAPAEDAVAAELAPLPPTPEAPPVVAAPEVAPVAPAAPVAPEAPLAVADASPAPDSARRTDAAAEPAPRSLAEAQSRALRRLDEVVRAAWDAGLPPGAAVAVSAPFRTRSGGVEYLWVELRQWSGANMAGVLVNEPYDVANLHKGDNVAVRQADVFDYIWKKGDGGREGNTTAPFVTR